MAGRQLLRKLIAGQVVAGVLTLGLATGALLREQDQEADCRTGLLPDARCTPGQVLTTSKRKVCTPGYAQTVRNVTTMTRRRVIARYDFKPSGRFEMDHLVPLSLGGSNDVTNLWPETAPMFYLKDRLEFALWRAVCDGRVKLRDAQLQIAKDWPTVRIPGLPVLCESSASACLSPGRP